MGVKYHVEFTLRSQDTEEEEQEFTGVVEVSQPTEYMYGTKDLELLLARNFELEARSVRLIHWERLQ